MRGEQGTMARMRRLLISVLLLGTPLAVSAHAVGDVFALNLPFRYLALAAAVALLYSFAAFLVFSEDDGSTPIKAGRIITTVPRPLHISTLAISALVTIGVIAIGTYGSDGIEQIAPHILWVYVLLGVTYVSAVIGGVWLLINPFWLMARVFRISNRGRLVYPSWLGYYPALVVYIALICIELFSGAGGDPHIVAFMVVAYAVITAAGTMLFGRALWFQYGDFLSVFFGFVSRMAVIFVREDRSVAYPEWAARLVRERPQHVSALVFIAFMLSSTSFDGLYDTQIWYAMVGASTILGVCGLVIVWLLTVALYVFAVTLMQRIAAPEKSLRELSLAFTYSLIPIAIAYNFAHYFTLLTGTIDVHAVWAVQVAVVVLGHVYATYVAHRVALRESTQRAVAGQIPMLLLMVLFTVFALWILSLGIQPE